jgi:hypothetical protein
MGAKSNPILLGVVRIANSSHLAHSNLGESAGCGNIEPTAKNRKEMGNKLSASPFPSYEAAAGLYSTAEMLELKRKFVSIRYDGRMCFVVIVD